MVLWGPGRTGTSVRLASTRGVGAVPAPGWGWGGLRPLIHWCLSSWGASGDGGGSWVRRQGAQRLVSLHRRPCRLSRGTLRTGASEQGEAGGQRSLNVNTRLLLAGHKGQAGPLLSSKQRDGQKRLRRPPGRLRLETPSSLLV